MSTPVAQTELFRGISETDCDRMMECFGAVTKTFSAGETVCRFRQKNSVVGIVSSGTVLVVRYNINGTRTILESLTAGSVFGECLSSDAIEQDTVYVIADTDCTIVFIHYEAITGRCSNLCGCHVKIVENMLELISNKVSTLSERVEVLSRRSIREKLLCYFSILASKAGSATVTIPMTMTALAEYISADRSAMLREMRNMEGDALLTANGKQVTLL